MDNLIERLEFILRFHDIRNQPYIEIKHQLLIDTYDRLVELEQTLKLLEQEQNNEHRK